MNRGDMNALFWAAYFRAPMHEQQMYWIWSRSVRLEGMEHWTAEKTRWDWCMGHPFWHDHILLTRLTG